MAQIRNFDNGNNQFLQQGNGALSVFNDSFNFFAGNDRLILLRDDDLAGLGGGVAEMGDGRDVVITAFNSSGRFNLGGGNDFFLSQGNFSFNAGDIVVRAGLGNDIIAVTTTLCSYFGEQGNDLFVSDGSSNFFDGGEGVDTYSLEAAESAARVDLASGQAFARFNLTPENLTSIENVRGTPFADEIFGDFGANRLDGLQGDDSIDGDGGNDTIFGDSGSNLLVGNTGFDTLVVAGTVTSRSRLSADTILVRGSSNGVAFEHVASGFEQVSLNGVLQSLPFFMGESASNSVQPTLIAEVSVLEAITGFSTGQTLQGDAQANAINGGAGFDDIAGLDGNDTLRGLVGDDHLFGGNGNDGLVGGAGGDLLNGGNGNDQLRGEAGRDVLIGGANNDLFFFTTAFAGSADTITDYNIDQDGLRIAASLVGLPVGALPATRFKNTALAGLDSDDRLIYNGANRQLLFDSNGSAAGGQVLIATFSTPGLALNAAEIVLI
ncbi:MAG: calcium-binding protein [Cyanobium sp.]